MHFQKKENRLIVLSDLIVLAGPAIYDNIRYALPVVYAVPIALAYFIYNSRGGKELK